MAQTWLRILALAIAAGCMARAGELEDAQKTVEKWRPVFFMKGWALHVHMVSLQDLARVCEKDCVAASLFNPEAKRGEILVMRRKDYSAQVKMRLGITDVRADQRNSVVHELLHCVIQHMNEEDAVSVIAAALKP